MSDALNSLIPPLVHACVREALIPTFGERIVAWVVVSDDMKPAADDLVAHVAELLTPHKRPRRVHFLGALPRNELGKVIRSALGTGSRESSRAKEILLLHPRLSAHEALAMGLINDVALAGEAVNRALELAERIAGLPPQATTLAKEMVDLTLDAPRDVAVRLEQLAYGLLAQTADARAASRAFRERTSP